MLGLKLAIACHYFDADHVDVKEFLQLVPTYDTSGGRLTAAPRVGETLVIDAPNGDASALSYQVAGGA
jgi:hypothetical protein